MLHTSLRDATYLLKKLSFLVLVSVTNDSMPNAKQQYWLCVSGACVYLAHSDHLRHCF
jgi:hypothetical protein